MGRGIQHPRLWQLSRRGIAQGVAIGVFYGLLLPFGQIPLAGITAILLRGNVPVAMASTFISNPVTFPLIYYFAYKLGLALMGGDPAVVELAGPWPDPLLIESQIAQAESQGWLAAGWAYLDSLGKPLLLGLVVMAVGGSLFAHLLMNQAWRVSARIAWRRRLDERSARRAAQAFEQALRAREVPPHAGSDEVSEGAGDPIAGAAAPQSPPR
ncbi:hypothetical protein SAMN04488509_101150 [Aquimonas voraii]|uniref:DUF2062 domain-containing protein n=2 Tax=Aquimonas voraii TaxID=265719 RepID=A0A1G6RWQ7_9GAMM|nr:hypothetical protein SAMN04488509_101150 [Aquimonas voraii]